MVEVPTASADEHDEEPDVEDESEAPVADGYFEEEYYISAEKAGQFLTEFGEQLETGDEVTITGDDWELPFPFGEPVELEIEYEGGTDPELEIEVELTGRTEDEPPEIT